MLNRWRCQWKLCEGRWLSWAATYIYFTGEWVDLDERKRPKSVPRLSSPAGLFIYVQNVDKAVAKATSLGATGQGPVMDMFWGDRCGTIVDPNGYRLDGRHA